MSYLDDVKGQYLTSEEVREAGEITFVADHFGRDKFKDGMKVVLVGKVGTDERHLVVNRARGLELRNILKGADESTIKGVALRLQVIPSRTPDGSDGWSIVIVGVARTTP